MKREAFPCENTIGINLQYDDKSGQRIMVTLIVKKETNTTPHGILGAVGGYMLNDIEI